MPSLSQVGKKISKGAKKVAKKATKAVVTGGGGQLAEMAKMGVDAITPDMPEIPVPEKEAVMPIPDEELSRSARRRARARRRGGRSSSILTGGDALGGY